VKQRLSVLGCALALVLTGCALVSPGESPPAEGGYPVYYSAIGDQRAGAAVDCVSCAVEEPVVPGLMNALLASPEAEGLRSPIPAGVRLLSWSLEEGQLHLDLSEQYGGLTGVELTLADSCIALTFCGLEGVESVYITVEGREIPYRRTQVLSAQDVLLSGAEEEPAYLGANLWYPRSQGDGLGVEYRQLLKAEGTPPVQIVLDAWLEGPQYATLRPCLPEGTQVRSVGVSEGICTIDLSAQFVENAPEDPGEARLMLYALVNTLGELDQAGRVRILCEGEPLPELGGVPLAEPLLPDPALEQAPEQRETAPSGREKGGGIKVPSGKEDLS